jgi:hypothetical protein
VTEYRDALERMANDNRIACEVQDLAQRLLHEFELWLAEQEAA